MILKTFISHLTVILSLLLPACQTTGNPREGGLFGWSKSKAEQRQAEFQQQADLATQHVNEQQAWKSLYQQQKEAKQLEVQLLEKRVANLFEENRKLKSQLLVLAKTKKVKSKELGKLNALLTELNSKNELSENQFSSIKDVDSKIIYANEIEKQNANLHDTIIFLLNYQ